LPKRFRRINVEISNICNLQCSFCPEVTRDKQVLNTDIFSDILAQAVPLTDEICLHLMGEPLGHPQFAQMIRMCADAGLPVNLSTNGLLLRGMVAEAAISPIVRQLNISVHSYLDNFPAADPAPYIEKICSFLDRAARDRPDLYVNLRLWDMQDETPMSPSARTLREQIGRRYGANLAEAKIDLRRRKNIRLHGRISAHFDTRFVWPDLSLPPRGSKGTCMGLRNHFGIHADGTVVPCCLDKEAVIRLGNVTEEPLEKILASAKAEWIKTGFEKHELREELCQRCSFISRFERKGKRNPVTDLRT